MYTISCVFADISRYILLFNHRYFYNKKDYMEGKKTLGKEAVMQIINLPGWLMIVSYIVLWPVFQAGIAWIGSRVPDRFFDPKSFWLKTRRWEKDGISISTFSEWTDGNICCPTELKRIRQVLGKNSSQAMKQST